MKTRFFVHAINVHQGGGRSLLEAIFSSLPREIKSILTLDERMPISADMEKSLLIKRVRPTLLRRFFAEIWLAKNVAPDDIVLCFGNLPPLFKVRGHAVVFVQNRYLIDDVKLTSFPLKTRLRLVMERLWLSARMANVSEFIVQTPSMKRLLDLRTKGSIPVRVLPFMENNEKYTRSIQLPSVQSKKVFDFLYVASGEPHKNHKQLIDAWCLLAREGRYPSLKLTLDKVGFAGLCSWIKQMTEQYRLNVENLGCIPHAQVKQLYYQVDALIYPSTFESFGLPLIEARQAGLPILASELDYVRDVLDPEQAFNPQSAISVARAVKRFMGVDDQPLPLQDASEFVRNILEGTE